MLRLQKNVLGFVYLSVNYNAVVRRYKEKSTNDSMMYILKKTKQDLELKDMIEVKFSVYECTNIV